MPIIDSSINLRIKDSKPPKVCQSLECPDYHTGYGNRKMKMCSRCNVVRYCSNTCQREDWPEHKLFCQIPPLLDIGEWMEMYDPLLRWALIEGLNLRNEPSNILSDALLVRLTRMDRIMVGVAPTPFLIDSVCRIPWAKMQSIGLSQEPRLKASRKIIEDGGVGQGLVVLWISDQLSGTIFRFQYHTIQALPPGEKGASCPGWQKIVKAVANGEIPVDLLSRMLEDRPSDSEEAASI
ncbi:MYND-type domain-containing protein [Favolaschia claudopus]|uniref:MYND-type domain-containing protein n=1 Tax=Favolaschia claudopus TaxID=2862362 RepID=A0AAW0CBK5_9AGAR